MTDEEEPILGHFATYRFSPRVRVPISPDEWPSGLTATGA